jgi:hypothetical protein
MNDLAKYDAAKRALAEAHRIDEVKDIRDKVRAMQEYARQAKDGQMIEWATDIRLRAERRAGQLLVETRERGERDDGRGNRNPDLKAATPKLADLGVTKTQSSRWQRLAVLDDEAFERRAEIAKRAAVHSVEATARPSAWPRRKPSAKLIEARSGSAVPNARVIRFGRRQTSSFRAAEFISAHRSHRPI